MCGALSGRRVCGALSGRCAGTCGALSGRCVSGQVDLCLGGVCGCLELVDGGAAVDCVVRETVFVFLKRTTHTLLWCVWMVKLRLTSNY